MTSAVEVQTCPEWSSHNLQIKAQLYWNRMKSEPKNSVVYALFASFSLEFLLRACLANIHPILLAEDKPRFAHLCYGLGLPTSETFLPKSIAISEVIQRLGELHPEFTAELQRFCRSQLEFRNRELHSGAISVESAVSEWLPQFFVCTSVLLGILDKTFEHFMEDEDVALATKMIKSFEGEKSKQVLSLVKAHKTVWDSTSSTDQRRLKDAAKEDVFHSGGQPADCPACGSWGVLTGTRIGEVSRQIEDLDHDYSEIKLTAEFLPDEFRCQACKLNIKGLSRLRHVGLGDSFKLEEHYSPQDYFEDPFLRMTADSFGASG